MSRAQRLRAGIISALIAVLIWLVIGSLAAYRNEHSLPINPDIDSLTPPVDATSGDTADLGQMDVDPTIPTSDQLASKAKQVVTGNPLNAKALRILGQISAAAGDDAQAMPLFQAAARRSLQETPAITWLLQKNFENGNFDKAIYYADALLRTRPQYVQQVTPILARILENESANSSLRQLLATNPPWRAAFLAALPAYIADTRVTLNLLLNLRDTSEPPTIDDFRNYLNFLVRNNLYEVAYYAWLQFIPPEQLTKVGFLINGSFEHEPTGLPFDWVIKGGSGVTADIARVPGTRRRHALFIEFGYGRINFDVAQLIMLPPGAYQLDGQYKGELKGRRGLVWRIMCAENGNKIGQSESLKGPATDWTDFSFPFTVPDSNCRAQTLQLKIDARSASEQLVSGSFWYDELKITRQNPTTENIAH